MNFYKHHIGDFDQATRHLSFVEDAAYSRLIRKYYAEEKPLPVDVKNVQRLVGARSRDEKEAVESMLSEFFQLHEDGWHNKRCDEELAKAAAQAEANRRVALEREARKRSRQEHELSTNRATGKTADGSTNRDDQEHESCDPPEHESFKSREPSHKPDSISQTPDLKEKEQHTTAVAETDPAPDVSYLPDPTPYGNMAKLMRQSGVNVTSANPILRQWVEDAVSLDEAGEAIAVARLGKPAPEPIAAAYLDAVIRGNRKAATRGRLPAKADVDAHGVPL